MFLFIFIFLPSCCTLVVRACRQALEEVPHRAGGFFASRILQPDTGLSIPLGAGVKVDAAFRSIMASSVQKSIGSP